MTRRHAPRLALALLERLVPDSEPLAGDLVEDFEQRKSTVWFWLQVLAAVATASFARQIEIRPLRLVHLQPADALERSRRMNLRFRSVNLSGSPVSGVGGLALVICASLVTVVVPGAWWLLLASVLAGVMLAIVTIAMRGGTSTPGPKSGPLSLHVR
jgi:hypothetical protein